MGGKKKSNSNTPKKTPPKAPPKAAAKAPKSPQSPPTAEARKSPRPETPPGAPPASHQFRFNTVGGIQHLLDEYVPELVLQTTTAVFEQIDEEQRGAVITRVARVAVETMKICPAHVLQQLRHDEETLTEVVARAIHQDPKWRELLEEWVAIAIGNVRSAESLARRSRTRSDDDGTDQEESDRETESRPTPRVTPLRLSAACPQCKLKIRNCVCPPKPTRATKKKPVQPRQVPDEVLVVTDDEDEINDMATSTQRKGRDRSVKRRESDINLSRMIQSRTPSPKNGGKGRHPEDMAALDYVMDPEKWDRNMTYDEYHRLKTRYREVFVDIHQKGTVHYSTADAVAQSVFMTLAHGQTAGFLVSTKLLERLRTVAVTPGIKQAQLDHIQSLIPSPSDDVPERFAKAREEQAKLAAKIIEERERNRPRTTPTFRGRGSGSWNSATQGAHLQTRGGYAGNNQGNNYGFNNNFVPTRGRGGRGM